MGGGSGMFWAFPLYASFPLRYASWEYACKRLQDIMSLWLLRGWSAEIDHIKPQKKITPNLRKDTFTFLKDNCQTGSAVDSVCETTAELGATSSITRQWIYCHISPMTSSSATSHLWLHLPLTSQLKCQSLISKIPQLHHGNVVAQILKVEKEW